MNEAVITCIATGCGIGWVISVAGYFAREILDMLHSL